MTLIWMFRMHFDGTRIVHPRSVFGTLSNICTLNLATPSQVMVQTKAICPPPFRLNILRQGNIEIAVTFLVESRLHLHRVDSPLQ